jgi:NADPH2:quinone reductase
MAKAIQVSTHGGPEVLTYTDVDPGKPGPGEVLIRHTAIGLNSSILISAAASTPPRTGCR